MALRDETTHRQNRQAIEDPEGDDDHEHNHD